MNYGDLQTNFSARLNRRDNTTTLTQLFIQDAIKRIQSELRIPAMEKGVVATIGNSFSGGLLVPGDLIELIAITCVPSGEELDHSNLERVLQSQLYEFQDHATKFYRRGTKYLIAPLPISGDQYQIDYYAAFAPLSASTDSNVLSDLSDDLILYAALVYGCTHFNDKRKDGFEEDYQRRLGELNQMGKDDELSGNASVAPALCMDLDPYV